MILSMSLLVSVPYRTIESKRTPHSIAAFSKSINKKIHILGIRLIGRNEEYSLSTFLSLERETIFLLRTGLVIDNRRLTVVRTVPYGTVRYGIVIFTLKFRLFMVRHRTLPHRCLQLIKFRQDSFRYYGSVVPVPYYYHYRTIFFLSLSS